MNKPRATLFVTTYEMPTHLELVFAALERQTTKEFEIIVCDDGSGSETKHVIDQFIERTKKHGISTRHVWQEHKGFRKCRILNEALRIARGEVCIFLDGDCVPHRHYVRDHLDRQEKGYYLAGRRVELGQKISAMLTPALIKRGFFDRPRIALLKSVLRKDSEFFQRSIRITNKTLRKILKMDHVTDLKGCNYSVPREALDALNGFDEAYEGYGREDTDVEIRLQNLGLKIKSLKGVALQFHVWHPRRVFTPANDDRLEELKRSGRVRCEAGIKDLRISKS